MNKMKQFIIAISITTTSFVNAADNLLESPEIIDFKNDKCQDLTETYLQKILRERKGGIVKNPFVDEGSTELKTCTEISFKENDSGNLNLEDFNGQLGVHKFYNNFLKDGEVKVSEAILANGQIYKFLKFNTDSEDNLFKRLRKGILKDHLETFLFFHELTHLNKRHSLKNKEDSNNELEATADIAGILMVKLTSNLSLDETKDMLSDLSKFRKNVGTKIHFSEKSFRNAKGNLDTVNFEELEKYDVNTAEGFKLLFRRVEQIAYDIQKLNKEEFGIKY